VPLILRAHCDTLKTTGTDCRQVSFTYNPSMPDSDKTDAAESSPGKNTIKDSIKAQSQSLGRYFEGHALRTNPFERTLTADQIYKRAERISAALFLVTAHVRNDDPIKMSVRSSALLLVQKAMSVHVSLRSEESLESYDLISTIRVCISQVRFLGIAGYVSHASVSTLVSALDELGHLVTSAQRSSLSELHHITPNDLIPRIESGALQRSPQPRDTVKGQKGQSEQSSRTERIIALLRTRELMGIRDIALTLPDYSEKMIQRELAGLVESGRVRKVGAKRWSRYGLV
jgi:hypothetical protein